MEEEINVEQMAKFYQHQCDIIILKELTKISSKIDDEIKEIERKAKNGAMNNEQALNFKMGLITANTYIEEKIIDYKLKEK